MDIEEEAESAQNFPAFSLTSVRNFPETIQTADNSRAIHRDYYFAVHQILGNFAYPWWSETM